MVINGFESIGSRSVDGELFACSHQEEIAVCLALCRSQVKTRDPLSEPPRCGYGRAATPDGSPQRSWHMSPASPQPNPGDGCLSPHQRRPQSPGPASNAHACGCGGSFEVEALCAHGVKAKACHGSYSSTMPVVVLVPFGSDKDPVFCAVKQQFLTTKESGACCRMINAKTLAEAE